MQQISFTIMYLYGTEFIIKSDYIFCSTKTISPTASSEIIRWTLTLSKYTFSIHQKNDTNLYLLMTLTLLNNDTA